MSHPPPTPQRYSPHLISDHDGMYATLEADDDGIWVSYQDFLAMRLERDSAMGDVERLRTSMYVVEDIALRAEQRADRLESELQSISAAYRAMKWVK